ncbi:MAG TPA: carboxylating nicotinate-nucleotide diphosphorylase [Candidatus Eremiobacteraceae bacterium]|nr:carboxylating nicotinate-nucleotide diphosphorylase [Candidatus Eremiobacteraceae bacterium]
MADVSMRSGRHPFLTSEPFVPMDASAATMFDTIIKSALAEDVGSGDITSRAVVDAEARWSGRIVARAAGVVAGLGIAARTFALVDPSTKVELAVADGSKVDAGSVLANVNGGARSLLTAERVALNFLGRLSGIATLTRRYVDATAGTSTKITDTRKTTPGLRALERYAVRAGGGVNHRFGLADAVLVKDNHIAAVGSVKEAVHHARAGVGPGVVVEIECDRLDQVSEALEAGADSVLLDNMDAVTMRKAVDLARGKAIVEASGGMTLERVAETAAAGVDVISVGALTHSAPALDVALDFDAARGRG